MQGAKAAPEVRDATRRFADRIEAYDVYNDLGDATKAKTRPVLGDGIEVRPFSCFFGFTPLSRINPHEQLYMRRMPTRRKIKSSYTAVSVQWQHSGPVSCPPNDQGFKYPRRMRTGRKGRDGQLIDGKYEPSGGITNWVPQDADFDATKYVRAELIIEGYARACLAGGALTGALFNHARCPLPASRIKPICTGCVS